MLFRSEVAANVATFGLKGLKDSAQNYYETGDPTQFQEYSGSFLAGALTAKGLKDAATSNAGRTPAGPAPKAAPKANLRQLYTDEVAGLEKVGKDLLASGKSEAEVAQTLNQMRRDLGIKYKEMTPPDLLDYIYKFNDARYGDKLGPTYEMLKQQGKTDAQIIASASRPLGDMKQLGAALYKQFGEEIAPILRRYGMLD